MTTKYRILELLKNNREVWVSGQDVSGLLNLSRTAVWKHIAGLRAEGYEIESSSRKGYLLRSAPSLLLPAEIRDGLKTFIWGKRDIVYHSETGSTNTDAKSIAVSGAPEGTVVIAEHQIKGRGRLGRSWFSPRSEGIYISIILRPRFSLLEAPILTPLMAVVTADTVAESTGLAVRIKWPNDIMVGGRKIGGILTEIGSEMDAVDYAVVGLGLNVYTSEFPEDLKDRATSIHRETRDRISRSALVRGYLSRLEKMYEQQKQSGFGPLLKRYRKLTSIVGREVAVDSGDRRITGRVMDLDDHGALMIQDKDGKPVRILSGDIHFPADGDTQQ